MGRLSTEAMLEMVEKRQALAWHLSSNHYPPIHSVMMEPCLTAIANADAGEWDAIISLPDGVSWRGQTECPTHALVEWAHLEAFLSEVGE